ncbi:MAG: DUF2252 family protein [Chitinophagaceae bacterium]|nr:DUF2252 family protein [Oligoflexus sp.]
MNAKLLRLLPIPLLVLIACQSNDDESMRHPPADIVVSRSSTPFPDMFLEALPPISSLTREHFDKKYPELNAEQLNLKWNAAKSSPMMFTRSYINAWYDDLATLSKIGPVGPCFGDAHIDNFGFLWKGSWTFTYNDFDDVGRCPVIFDALRFFTTVSFALNDTFEVETIRNAYLGFLNGDSLSTHVSDSYKPKADDLNTLLLSKLVKGSKLVDKVADLPVTPTERKKIFEAITASLNRPSDLTLLDIKGIIKNSGGSAGHKRYDVLARKPNGELQLLELKESTAPASERGSWAVTDKISRLEFAKILWGKDIPWHMTFPVINSVPYQLRSKNKTGMNFDKMQAGEQILFFTEEAYAIAQVHKLSIRGTPEYGVWLAAYTPFMVERYTQIVKNAN